MPKAFNPFHDLFDEIDEEELCEFDAAEDFECAMEQEGLLDPEWDLL